MVHSRIDPRKKQSRRNINGGKRLVFTWSLCHVKYQQKKNYKLWIKKSKEIHAPTFLSTTEKDSRNDHQLASLGIWD